MFGLEDEYYEHITRQAKLIEALKAECDAAFDILYRDERLDDCTSYNAARAARLKIELEETL